MLALLAGLSTGHKIGLAVVAAVFIGFALSASFLAPRRWPDFPGRNALGVFVIASFVLFFGMLAAVYVFGKESEAKGAEAPPGKAAQRTIEVTESEFRIQLPSREPLAPGTYTFDVRNEGKTTHDLVVQGGNAGAPARSSLIQPGAAARLTVSLTAGKYTLYCSVDGHRKLGMQTQISVR